MKGIKRQLIQSGLVILLCSAVLHMASTPFAAQATCSQWDMSGEWKFVQTNGTSPVFTLKHTPTGLQGSAIYYYEYDDSGYYFPVTASVDGVLNGDSFEITAYWSDLSPNVAIYTTGVYKGKISPQGRLEGSTYDKKDPRNKADFYSDRNANCASQAACSRWDMSGKWTFVQTNDTSPEFTLEQTRTGLQGTAVHRYTHKDENIPGFKVGDSFYRHTATVNGAINGNSIEITAYWSNGTTGIYTGTIGPEGRIEGSTYDKQHPGTTARWHTDRVAKCLAGSAGTGERSGTTSSALKTAPPLAPPVWQNWFRITNGGGLKAPVTALSPSPGHIDLFVVGNEGGVYSTYHEAAGGWRTWFRIGGLTVPTQSPVTALATRPGHIDLFVVGSDGGVYSTYHEAQGGWRNWFRIGYVGVAARSNVAAIQPRPGHIDLFVVGGDGKIYSTYHETEGRGWLDWFPIHDMRSPPGSEITALVSRPGHIDLFVSGTEGGVYSTYHEAAGGWRQWSRIWGVDMQPGSPVTALKLPTNKVSLFVVGKDKKVQSTYRLGASNWEGWLPVSNLGATPGTRVEALDTRLGHTDLFAVGTDGGIYSTYIEGSDWKWQPSFRVTNMVSTAGAAVTALRPRPGHIDLFVSGLDSGVYSTFFEAGSAGAQDLLKSTSTTSSPTETSPGSDRRRRRVPPPAGTPPSPSRPICDLARQARERNSPAAPGLEEKCRTITKGEQIANEDPLAVELREQQSGDRGQDGFNFGMALAEGQTAPGPGKDQACTNLSSRDEQDGCRNAVLFSVERNRNAPLASKGAEIAQADPTIAEARNTTTEARNGKTNVFYRLGFNIGLAASEGHTAPGPGKDRLRDSLAPALQAGFSAAVSFTLERNRPK